tara:strand:- start:40 stop:198 length:159 start_codon:yes stop_codon:yes gene_type:complete
MMKLEMNEVVILLTIIENATFTGKDIPTMSRIINKLQTEVKKLGEKRADGKK